MSKKILRENIILELQELTRRILNIKTSTNLLDEEAITEALDNLGLDIDDLIKKTKGEPQ